MSEQFRMDFASGDSGTLRWMAGRGDGTFTFLGGTDGLGRIADLTAADFDHDGNVDLLALDRDDRRVGLLRGRGDGEFAPIEFTALNAPSGDWTRNLASADFDGDGFLDVATLGDSGTINVLTNTAVPEPAALTLSLAVALLLVGSDRSRTRRRCAVRSVG